jgi:hypothetical protein
MKENNFLCHSGGCPGSDMEWENEACKYGIKTIAYSFYNHVQKGRNPKILSVGELDEGYDHVKLAAKTIGRNPNPPFPYIRNLLCRNWFQVKNAEVVFAVGMFMDHNRVSGGTGWAVQMAIDSKKPVFVFDQIDNKWTTFNYETKRFESIDYIPTIPTNFAGVGTRKINSNGIAAIQNILKHNFGK